MRALRTSSIFLLVLAISGCNVMGLFTQESSDSYEEDKEEATVLTDENGIVIAAIDADSWSTQFINGSDDSNISGAIVEFPPGSLAIDSNISLEEGVSLSGAGIGADLGISGNSESGGPTVVVQSSAEEDAAEAFRLAIPSDQGLSLAVLDNIIVVYHVHNYAEGPNVFRKGLYPRSMLRVESNKVSFDTTFFGSYQILLTEEEITEEKDISAADDFSTKNEYESGGELEIDPGTAPTDISYGSSLNFTVKINNVGKGRANNISFSGLAAPFSKVSTTCEDRLEPGNRCEYTIKFTSGGSGSYTDTLIVDYNEGASVSATLTATGNKANVSVGPLYPTSGIDWNDYIKWVTATSSKIDQDIPETTCDPTDGVNYNCIHAGELRKVSLTGAANCSGLSIVEDLGAFKWECSVISGTATFISVGLNDGAGLNNLVDASGWYDNYVTVTDDSSGRVLFQSDPAKWWLNEVGALPDTTGVETLATAGKVYVSTLSGSVEGYNINADKISIVVKESYELVFDDAAANCATGSGETSTPDRMCLISVGDQDHIWLEGNFASVTSANKYDFGILMYASNFSQLRNLGVSNGGAAGYAGIRLTNSADNFLSNVISSNNGGDGLDVAGTAGKRNRLHRIRTSNNAQQGLKVSSSAEDAVLTHIVSFNNGGMGLYINASNCVVSHATLTNNNSGGLYHTASSGDVFQVVSLNNSADGITIKNVSTNPVEYGQMVSIGSSTEEFEINPYAASEYTFKGNLIVDSGGTCNSAHSNNGINGSCAFSGQVAGSHRLSTADTLDDSFDGKIDTTDSNNGAGGPSTEIGSINDWVVFDNFYRAWGKDGSAFPNSDNTGYCNSGNCMIWDWQLMASDDMLLNRSYNPASLNPSFGSGCPDAMHDSDPVNWATANTSGTKFLINATEYMGDAKGDDDGLCESGEACIYSPNYGAYQGHGDLEVTSCAGTANVTDVEVYYYTSNGI